MPCARHDDCCQDCGRRYCCQSCRGQNFQENPNEPCSCEQDPTVPTFAILKSEMTPQTQKMQMQKKQVTIRIYYIIDGAEACYQRDSASFMENLLAHSQPFRDSTIYEIYPGHWFQASTLENIENYDYLCFYELETVDKKILGNLYCFRNESFEKEEAPGIIHQIHDI